MLTIPELQELTNSEGRVEPEEEKEKKKEKRKEKKRGGGGGNGGETPPSPSPPRRSYEGETQIMKITSESLIHSWAAQEMFCGLIRFAPVPGSRGFDVNPFHAAFRFTPACSRGANGRLAPASGSVSGWRPGVNYILSFLWRIPLFRLF